MPPTNSYLDYVNDLFTPFGAITIKKMFGGAGVYCDDRFFAIIGDDNIYFKVDDVTRAAFEGAGLEPFTIEMKDGRTGSMSYYNAPEEVFDDHDALKKWTILALDAAVRARKPRRGRKLKQPAVKKAAKKKIAKKTR